MSAKRTSCEATGAHEVSGCEATCLCSRQEARNAVSGRTACASSGLWAYLLFRRHKQRVRLLTHTLPFAQWKAKSAQPRMLGRFRKRSNRVRYPATVQPACCCTCNLHVAAGIYRQSSMSAVSTLPFERLSDYGDAPKPTEEQFQEYLNMQKSLAPLSPS